MLFGTYGVLTGMNPEAARASFVDGNGGSDRTSRSRIVPLAVAAAAVVCLLVGVSSIAWADRLMGSHDAWLVLVVVLTGTAMSGHPAVGGVLAGRGAWRGLALLTTWEAVLRLVLVGVALVVSDSVAGLALASAASSAAWVLLRRQDFRRAVQARSDTTTSRQLTGFAHACAASASTAALVVGFPVLMRATSTSVEYAGAAPLLLAVSLTRAPLLVPLNAYQGVALHHFMRERARGARALLPLLGVVLGVTVLGAGLAALVGPWLFTLLLGSGYAMDGAVLALLTIGAGMLGLLTLTGASCLATAGHRAYAVGWVAATVTAVLVLLAPLDLQTRTELSLVVSCIPGVAVHAWAISGASRRSPGPTVPVSGSVRG